MTFNLLTEPVFRVETGESSRVTASLPEVYAALRRDDVVAFPGLRPHQRHALHAFLVQLGAMALHKAGVGEPPADAPQWEKLIRGLTADFPDDEPWRLVVDDITKPAFMQPPASSEDKRNEYKHRVTTPDALDMLVTSKNHDLKSSVATQAGVDDWIFALITLQTMGGYSRGWEQAAISYDFADERKLRQSSGLEPDPIPLPWMSRTTRHPGPA